MIPVSNARNILPKLTCYNGFALHALSVFTETCHQMSQHCHPHLQSANKASIVDMS